MFPIGNGRHFLSFGFLGIREMQMGSHHHPLFKCRPTPKVASTLNSNGQFFQNAVQDWQRDSLHALCVVDAGLDPFQALNKTAALALQRLGFLSIKECFLDHIRNSKRPLFSFFCRGLHTCPLILVDEKYI